MARFELKIVDKNGAEKASKDGQDEVNLFYTKKYEEGDRIILKTDEGNQDVWLQWDEALGKSLVYLSDSTSYQIPFHEKRCNLSPKAFEGDRHLVSVCVAEPEERENYRNLALNVCDQHDIQNLYPHALANVETRGEAVFAAQNAIDGVTANISHGEWPYQSWGINMQNDAKIRIDFGRLVEIDRIVLYTRADFPHDNWWEEVSISFSDGSEEIFYMEKSMTPHRFHIERRKITWLEMHDMKKADDPSPFPALSQIQVYGRTAK